MSSDENIISEKDKSYCVYKHTNLINGKVYIGITCQDPKARWSYGHGYCKNEYFYRSIKKYGWNTGFSHEILYEDLTCEEACEKEIELIAYHNSTNPNFGYNHSNGGKCNDYETIIKVRNGNQNKKGVIQYSKNGNFIAEYKSRAEASRETGIKVQDISSACRGKIFSAGGYLWCDIDNIDKIKRDLEKYREKMEHVLQFDLCGNLLCEYPHVYDAADKTGIDHYEISKVCFSELKPLYNFLFCYKSKEYKVKKWIKNNLDVDITNVLKN